MTSDKSRKITFYAPLFRKGEKDMSVSVVVHIENGDVAGILETVKEDGGVWSPDGSFFIPYPCACVEVE